MWIVVYVGIEDEDVGSIDFISELCFAGGSDAADEVVSYEGVLDGESTLLLFQALVEPVEVAGQIAEVRDEERQEFFSLSPPSFFFAKGRAAFAFVPL